MVNYFLRYLASVIILGVANQVAAADIYPDIKFLGSEHSEIVIEGEIKKGDYQKFVQLLEEGQGRFDGVILMSPGGNFDEAVKIGRVLRELQLDSSIPYRNENGSPACRLVEPRIEQNCTCLSACFFIHVGASSRTGDYAGVHRPFIQPEQFKNLSREEARQAFTDLQNEAQEYLREMNVPDKVQEIIFATPSDQIQLLAPDIIKGHFLGPLPYLAEWYRAKCSALTPDEIALWKGLSERGKKQELHPEETLTLEKIKELARGEIECRTREMKQARVAAFEAFFHQAPNDYRNHKFSIWSEATELIGLPSDILQSQGFANDPLLAGLSNRINLKRSASPSTPEIFASDSYMPSAGTIGVIHVKSHYDPSDVFVESVLDELVEKLGKPDNSSTANLWHWTGSKFSATLQLRAIEFGELKDQDTKYLSLLVQDLDRLQ